MPTWDKTRQKVQNAFGGNDPKNVSNLKYMMEIIDKAEQWEIDPKFAEIAKPSNLREIIREARLALDIGDKDWLVELFRLASYLTNRDLRLQIRDLNLVEIAVKKLPGKYAPRYQIEVTSAQLEKIKNATKLQFSFRMKDEEKEKK